MKSTRTPHTHVGVTKQQLSAKVGPSNYEITVPAGVRCHKLDGGSMPWVVEDLSFITDKNGMLFWDADHYGLHIPEDAVTDIQEKV